MSRTIHLFTYIADHHALSVKEHTSVGVDETRSKDTVGTGWFDTPGKTAKGTKVHK